MKKVIIAPSILSMDYSQPSEQMDLLKESNADWIHYDVMDTFFVPNITFGADLLRGMKKRTNLKLDVHLMVQNTEMVADIFLKEDIHCLTIHYETLKEEELISLAKKIKNHNVLAGISFKPKTDVNKIIPLLPFFDLVLVMGVEPGFGGQAFMESTPDTISALKTAINKQSLTTLIEVDGGINQDTAKKCIEAGVDVLVAGSYVFKGNIKENIDSLWKLS